jgi:hypothetical protein
MIIDSINAAYDYAFMVFMAAMPYCMLYMLITAVFAYFMLWRMRKMLAKNDAWYVKNAHATCGVWVWLWIHFSLLPVWLSVVIAVECCLWLTRKIANFPIKA